jgi:hypothetical protein
MRSSAQKVYNSRPQKRDPGKPAKVLDDNCQKWIRMSQAAKTDETWEEFERAAERILVGCGSDMQSPMAGGMVFPSQLGRLRRLADDTAIALGVPVADIEDRVKPYEDKLAKICGL